MPHPHKKIDIGKALKQKLKGMTYREIAETQGIHHSAVHQAIAPILQQFEGAEELAEYKQHSADIFHAIAYKALKGVNSEDIDKASLKDKVMSAAIATDKARLISGQSTQNLAVFMASACADSDD